MHTSIFLGSLPYNIPPISLPLSISLCLSHNHHVVSLPSCSLLSCSPFTLILIGTPGEYTTVLLNALFRLAILHLKYTFAVMHQWAHISLISSPLSSYVVVLNHPPTSSVLSAYILQTTLVHVMLDVIHPPHSLSSFCPHTSHFHLHRLLHFISFIHLQNLSISAQSRFQCDFSAPKSLISLTKQHICSATQFSIIILRVQNSACMCYTLHACANMHECILLTSYLSL